MKFNKSFFKKFFLVSGGILLAMIAIFAVIYTVLNIKWGRELRSELEKMKASGEPMTIKEIAPAPLASSENASIEYLQIFSLLTDGTYSAKGTGNINEDLKELDKLCFSIKNMAELEEQCKKNSVRIREILGKESFMQIFELCQKAAAKPGVNFNINYDEGPGLLLPHLSMMRTIARLLRIKAEMEMLEGQRDKAWETILTGLKLSSQQKNEPILMSELVYFVCENIYFDFISYNLPHYGISDEQARKLIAELTPDKTGYARSIKRALDGERICFGGWWFERVISGRSSDLGPFSSFIYRPLAKKEYVEYLKIMKSYKPKYDQPYFNLTSSVDVEKMIKSLPIFCIMTKLLCPYLGSVRLKTAEIETRSQEVCLRLALEEYKNLKAAYPDKLDQLSPQFLKEIPVSNMNGFPFEYSKENGSYTISGGIPEKK